RNVGAKTYRNVATGPAWSAPPNPAHTAKLSKISTAKLAGPDEVPPDPRTTVPTGRSSERSTSTSRPASRRDAAAPAEFQIPSTESGTSITSAPSGASGFSTKLATL